MLDPEPTVADEEFERLLGRIEPDLNRAFATRFGVTVGAEVMADVTAWAWEHRRDLAGMDNPAGYLFRVGQSAARRYVRWSAQADLPQAEVDLAATQQTDVDPGLDAALARLGDDQRVAVVMVHGYGLSYSEAADLVGVPVTTLRNRLRRGLHKLRKHLEVHDDI